MTSKIVIKENPQESKTCENKDDVCKKYSATSEK